MRKSNWTPSIVPRGDDQNVYLVMDDFDRLGRCWRKTDVEATDLETVITDLLDGQYNNPVAWSHSTHRKNGRRMSRPTLPKSCAGAAICSCATCHPLYRISSKVMKPASGGN